MYRQGDVYLQKMATLPKGLKELKRKEVAFGEVTGHAHRLDVKLADDAMLYENDKGELWVSVKTATALVHEEHETIQLEPGVYRYIPQREYMPDGIRNVQD